MRGRITTLRRDLSKSLAFVPGLIVAAFAALGVGLVEVDGHARPRSSWLFQGDAQAARTVLSVISGSLITVAGLTFSITIVVLQLASSQFTPRIVRTFFGDRVTQMTIGTFVGIFVYALLVLRAVGSYGDAGFVPRLSVTAGALLAMAAVVLLIVYLSHVAGLIQVSRVVADVTAQTLARIDVLHPEPVGPEDDPAGALLAEWHAEPPERVLADAPGFVRRIDVSGLRGELAGGAARRVSVLARAGDLVALDTVLAEVWPPAGAVRSAEAVRRAIVLGHERDLEDDIGFGVRQLTDVALRALSPGINDPATAVTCIGYLRSVLVRIAARDTASQVHHDDTVTLVVARRGFEETLAAMAQIGRSAKDDAWVSGKLLGALAACARSAADAGAQTRVRAVAALADDVAEQAIAHAGAGDADALRAQVAELRRLA